MLPDTPAKRKDLILDYPIWFPASRGSFPAVCWHSLSTRRNSWPIILTMDHNMRRNYIFIYPEHPRYLKFLLLQVNKISSSTKTSEKRNDAIYWSSIHWVIQANTGLHEQIYHSAGKVRGPLLIYLSRVKLSWPWARRKRKGEMPPSVPVFLFRWMAQKNIRVSKHGLK